MALPVYALGLLAQGIRVIATKIATSPAARKKAQEIIAANIKKSTEKGLIPSVKTIGQGLTKKQKGLLGDIAKTQPAKSTGRMNLGERVRAQARPDWVKKALARRNEIGRRESQSLQKLINDKIKARQAAYGRKPITQTKDAGYTTRESLGLLGGATAVPLIGGAIGGFANQETPQQVSAPTPLPATEPAPRFMQVINPGYDSTGKEVLNAALLRAGLRMAGGGNLRETIDAAASVADSRNIFRTGEEALAAGRRNLGEAADIGIRQNADGTYSYSGALEGDPVAQMDNLVQSAQRKQKKGQPSIITKEILEVAMRANPSKSEEEVISELEKAGYTNPTA